MRKVSIHLLPVICFIIRMQKNHWIGVLKGLKFTDHTSIGIANVSFTEDFSRKIETIIHQDFSNTITENLEKSLVKQVRARKVGGNWNLLLELVIIVRRLIHRGFVKKMNFFIENMWAFR